MKALEKEVGRSIELRKKLTVVSTVIHEKLLSKRKFHERAIYELERQLIMMIQLIESDMAIRDSENYTSKSFTELTIERKNLIAEIEHYLTHISQWVLDCIKALKK